MSYIWSRTSGASGPSISVVFDSGAVITVGKDHASIAEITRLLASEAPDAEIQKLINPVKGIAARLQRLSERVTTDGASIYFDGDALHDTLAQYILSLVRLEATESEAPSWKPFVSFLEKLSQNPSEASQTSLYSFIEKHGLTVLPNGDFIAYKGIRTDYKSVRSGPGVVNNVVMNGHLPNKPGSVIEMQRSLISDDINVGCAVGLHAGTAGYAAKWGPLVMAVAINPRDVVSVPTDSSFEKIRVSRYEVLTELARPEKAAATVGRASAPIYKTAVSEEANAEFVKKIEKAIKKGRTLKVEYISRSSNSGPKEYIIKPVSLKGMTLELTLPEDNNAIRTFRMERIKSIAKLDS